MDSMLHDIRSALRQLKQSRAFALLAVTTLALGIGANTAMYAVVDSVIMRPLPYSSPGRLVYIGRPDSSGLSKTSWLNYRDIRDQATTLDSVACYSDDIGVVQTDAGYLSLVAPGASASIFTMLGVKPTLGRTFIADEDVAGGPRAALLSEALWREGFGSDPHILGRSIRINGQPRTIVGVMPGSFRFPESAGNEVRKAVWLSLQPTDEMSKERGYNLFSIVASLKQGVTPATGQKELNAIAERIRAADTKAANLSLVLSEYQTLITGPVRPVFLALSAALALVLLIACANVANLLIARCLARQHEFAVRAAIGAGRFRLARQLLFEAGTLSALGAGAGFVLAEVAVTAVHKLAADIIPRSEEIAVRWPIVGILAAIATATTLMSATIPVFLVTRSDPQKALQAGSRGGETRSMRRGLSSALIAVEVALSVLLLMGTGLLFRTLWNLQHARLGFETTSVTSFSAMPSDATGFANAGVSSSEKAPVSIAVLSYQPALERLRSVPGVHSAALITAPPLSGITLGTSFEIVGRVNNTSGAEIRTSALMTAVSGEYARVMGTPVLKGRMIDEADGSNAPYVVAINETLARTYFGGADPIGQQLDIGGKERGMVKPYAIVGVLADQVDSSVAQPPRPLLMIPYQQIPSSSIYYPLLLKTVVHFVVRTGSNIAIAPAARAVFKETAPDFALDGFRTMSEVVSENTSNQRSSLYLIATFAGIAVLMVIAGLYGVLTQLIGYRRREFGIRLALGATQAGIRGIVLRHALYSVAAGLLAGVPLALASGRILEDFLYGVRPSDAATVAGVILLLLAVSSATALIPARRGAATDPMKTLRED